MKRKLISLLIAVLVLGGMASADWKLIYDPLTGKNMLDYYEPVSGSNMGALADVTFTGTAQGDIIYRGATVWNNLPAVAVNQALVSGGVGVAPAYSGTPTVQTLATTDGIDVNSDGATGEIGVDFNSINSTFSTIAQSDAEGIANKSNLRIGLDDDNMSLLIIPRSLMATDFGLSAPTDPTIRLYDNTGGGHATFTHNALDFSDSALLNLISGRQMIFQAPYGGDQSSGNIFTFNSAANSEITDTNAEQAWMYLEPKVKQTSTAAFNGLYINGTLASLGDGTTGDGNNYFRIATGGATVFRIDTTGGIFPAGMKSGATQVAAGAATGELWVDTDDGCVKLGT